MNKYVLLVLAGFCIWLPACAFPNDRMKFPDKPLTHDAQAWSVNHLVNVISGDDALGDGSVVAQARPD